MIIIFIAPLREKVLKKKKPTKTKHDKTGLALNATLEYIARSKKIIPNNVQTKYSRASYIAEL